MSGEGSCSNSWFQSQIFWFECFLHSCVLRSDDGRYIRCMFPDSCVLSCRYRSLLRAVLRCARRIRG